MSTDPTLTDLAGQLEVARQERDGLQKRLAAAEALRKGLPVCPYLIAAHIATGKSLSRHRGDGDTRVEKASECYMERCGMYQAGRCRPDVDGKAPKVPTQVIGSPDPQ